MGQVGEGHLLGADADAVCQLVQQAVHRRVGGVYLVLQLVQLSGQLAGGSRRIPVGLVHQPLQGVQFPLQLLQGIGAVLQNAGRLHLPHNAATLLAGMDGAVVHAAFDVARLAACNAAYIVADVVIPHIAPVHAGPDDTGRTAGHTAHVGDVGGALGLEQVFHRQVFQFHFVLAHGGVDVGQIGAPGHHPVVAAGHAADKMVAVHAAADRAPGNNAVGGVGARNAAHLVGAGHGALKTAGVDGAGVFPGNAAHFRPGPARLHRAGDGGLPHGAFGLDVTEQPLHAAVGGQGQAADGVAAALPQAAEAGNAGKSGAGQVDVRVQIYDLVPAPAVQTAIFRQLEQVVGVGEMDGVVPVLRKDRRGQAGEQKGGAQQGTQSPFDCLGHYTSSPSV